MKYIPNGSLFILFRKGEEKMKYLIEEAGESNDGGIYKYKLQDPFRLTLVDKDLAGESGRPVL